MSKYTPGPWFVSEDRHNSNKPGGHYADMGKSICAHDTAEEGPWYICRIEAHAPDEEANARLIAAAPDMLEALKLGNYNTGWSVPASDLLAAANVLRSYGHDSLAAAIERKYRAEAAAIAKAEGTE